MAGLTHKTKTIQIFGKSIPIILQDRNGVCPLLSICNVLLLKNELNLGQDISEISQDRLLSLVRNKLIDLSSNIDGKLLGELLDLLPRFATGIDVNIIFKGITEFEFTRECAIFDLLGIPLYHGWIVDPQDSDTYNAIGSKSYNTIMGDLVSLKPGTVGSKEKGRPEEYSVDFVAATTANLGVPSPGLSSRLSFDDSTGSVRVHPKVRKGDLEETAQLLEALLMSELEEKGKSRDSTDARNASAVGCKNEITPQEKLIEDFLTTNASQLTVYGLFCLKKELKELEPCVFFRNNHFNTMFKCDGQLYLLVTDQGYINQPDLVWERLNEVNGNNMFMTGSFKEFRAAGDHVNNTWDEAAVKESSPLGSSTRSFQQHLPSSQGVSDERQAQGTMFSQSQRSNGGLQTDDGVQRKLSFGIFATKGQGDGSSNRVLEVPVKEVAQENAENTENKPLPRMKTWDAENNLVQQFARTKLLEGLRTMATPTKQFSNSQTQKRELNSDKKKNYDEKPRQHSKEINSATIGGSVSMSEKKKSSRTIGSKKENHMESSSGLKNGVGGLRGFSFKNGNFNGVPSELNEEVVYARAVSSFNKVLEILKIKIKSEAEKKSAEILTKNAMKVQLMLQEAESEIQEKVRKLTDIDERRRHLETILQEQKGELEGICERFRNEVNAHFEKCKNTLEGLELQQTEFKDMVEKHAPHGNILNKVGKEIDTQLSVVKRELNNVQKSAREDLLKVKTKIAEYLEDPST